MPSSLHSSFRVTPRNKSYSHAVCLLVLAVCRNRLLFAEKKVREVAILEKNYFISLAFFFSRLQLFAVREVPCLSCKDEAMLEAACVKIIVALHLELELAGPL